MTTYKFKFLPSKKNRHLNRQVQLAGCIYNHLIALHKRYFKYFKKYPNKFLIQKHLTKLKKQQKFLFWNQLNSQTIQNISERIDFGYQKFFRKENKRPPTFRKIFKFKSFTLKQCGYKLFENNSIQIGKTVFKYHKSRNIHGNVKNVIIKKDLLGDFYLYFVTDHQETNQNRTETGETAGFDFGLKTFLVGSDETNIKSPLFFKQSLKAIRKASKNLSSKQKGSNHRKKARLHLVRKHRKIVNQRNDFHFKLARELCLKYDSIFLETLNLSGMKRMWGRKISDLSFVSFLSILRHQSEKLGTNLIFIDKWFPSSKMCSGCFSINDHLKLSDRTWTCAACGCTHDRDLNASKNIFREGTSSLRLGDRRLPLAEAVAA